MEAGADVDRARGDVVLVRDDNIVEPLSLVSSSICDDEYSCHDFLDPEGRRHPLCPLESFH